MVDERTRDLNEARAETLQLLAVASEYRDDETSQHTERIGEMAAAIGARMGLSRESVALLREAAPLHDIGKLAIPDSVLLKPARLTRAGAGADADAHDARERACSSGAARPRCSWPASSPSHTTSGGTAAATPRD